MHVALVMVAASGTSVHVKLVMVASSGCLVCGEISHGGCIRTSWVCVDSVMVAASETHVQP